MRAILIAGLFAACGGAQPIERFDCTAAYVCPGAFKVWEPAQYVPVEGADPAEWVECSCKVDGGELPFWYLRQNNKTDCDLHRESWLKTGCGL